MIILTVLNKQPIIFKKVHGFFNGVQLFYEFWTDCLFLFQYLVERIHTNYALQVKTNDLCIIMCNVVRSYTKLMCKRMWMTTCFPPFPYMFNWLWYSEKRSEYHSQLKITEGGGKHWLLGVSMAKIARYYYQTYTKLLQNNSK